MQPLQPYFNVANIIKIKAMGFSDSFSEKFLSKKFQGNISKNQEAFVSIICSDAVMAHTCIPFVILPVMVGVVSSIPTGNNSVFAETLKVPWCQFCTKMPQMSDLCYSGKTRIFLHLNSKHYVLNSHESIRRLK